MKKMTLTLCATLIAISLNSNAQADGEDSVKCHLPPDAHWSLEVQCLDKKHAAQMKENDELLGKVRTIITQRLQEKTITVKRAREILGLSNTVVRQSRQLKKLMCGTPLERYFSQSGSVLGRRGCMIEKESILHSDLQSLVQTADMIDEH